MAKPKTSRPNAARPARQGLEDEIEFEASGRIRLIVNGETYQLRRPLIGELRAFTDDLEPLREPIPADLSPEKNAQWVRDRQDAIVRWWQNTVAVLEVDGGQLPENEDDCPPWLSTGSLLLEAQTHWMTVPLGRGGSPSTRQQEQEMKLLEKLGPARGPARATVLERGSADGSLSTILNVSPTPTAKPLAAGG